MTLTSPPQNALSAESTPRVIAITTVRSALQANVLWVQLETEDGLTGLGETFYGASVVDSYVHDHAAQIIKAAATSTPVVLSRALAGYVGYSGSGAETRGNSAIDIALWDITAKRAGLPLRSLLGGPFRPSIPVYNTCAGNHYVSQSSQQASHNWGLQPGDGGRYEDLHRFLTEPGKLAVDLRAEGYGGMKVWPFDLAAEASGGSSSADLSFGVWVLGEIRDAVGDDMDLYVELHSLWQPRGAERVLHELERFDVAWAEDPVRADRWQTLRTLRGSSSVPIAAGESVGAGANGYGPLIENNAVDIAIIDMGWSGGITQGLTTAALAHQRGIPIAPHDCTGPVSLAVAGHLVTTIPNGHIQEVSRAFYHGWYQEVATGLPQISDGELHLASLPGHGVGLSDSVLSRANTTVRTTRLEA